VVTKIKIFVGLYPVYFLKPIILFFITIYQNESVHTSLIVVLDAFNPAMLQ